MGSRLKAELEGAFGQHPHVAEVRGAGLLLAIEIVADRSTLARFPASGKVSGRVLGEAFARGVSFYPGGNGEIRDVVVVGPPFTITDGDVDRIVTTLVTAVDAATSASR